VLALDDRYRGNKAFKARGMAHQDPLSVLKASISNNRYNFSGREDRNHDRHRKTTG
jgi:hypothetical protein